jgi:hypothetical protein
VGGGRGASQVTAASSGCGALCLPLIGFISQFQRSLGAASTLFTMHACVYVCLFSQSMNQLVTGWAGAHPLAGWLAGGGDGSKEQLVRGGDSVALHLGALPDDKIPAGGHGGWV